MQDDRQRVESALLEAVRTPDAYLTEIASHLITAGGKRLRPVMSIAAAQVGGSARVSEQVVQGGISCELVHLGSLYHDDVMDESTLRRGVETVNAKWGNLQAILAGDFLLARASEIAASLGTEVARLLARTIGRLCEGQIEELQHTYDTNRTVESYLASIDGKKSTARPRHCFLQQHVLVGLWPGTIVMSSTRLLLMGLRTESCSKLLMTFSTLFLPTMSLASQQDTTWKRVFTHCLCC